MSGQADATLDGAALERLRRLGGEALLARMIDLFLENSAVRMESARASAAGLDPQGVSRAVHSLKSSAGNVGAHALQRAADEMERIAALGDVEGMTARFPELERACAGARERLSREREGLAA